jgi:hypothetical protein
MGVAVPPEQHIFGMSLRFFGNILTMSDSSPFRTLSPLSLSHLHSFSEETEMFRHVDAILFEGDILFLVPRTECLYLRHPFSTIYGCFCPSILTTWATYLWWSEGFSLHCLYSIVSIIYSSCSFHDTRLAPSVGEFTPNIRYPDLPLRP